MISAYRLRQLRELIAQGREWLFYSWPEWKSKRAEVMRLDRNECQHCKAKGRYKRGTIVHHVKHLRDRPDLALSITDPDTGERQLVLVCKDCHTEEHPEAFRQNLPKAPPLTEERWD